MKRCLFLIMLLNSFLCLFGQNKDGDWEWHAYLPTQYEGSFALVHFCENNRVIYKIIKTDNKEYDRTQLKSEIEAWVICHEFTDRTVNVQDELSQDLPFLVLTLVEERSDRYIYALKFIYNFIAYGNRTPTFYYAWSKEKKRLLCRGGSSLETARIQNKDFYENHTQDIDYLYSIVSVAAKHGKRNSPNDIINIPGPNYYNTSPKSNVPDSKTQSKHRCTVCKGTGKMTRSWYVHSDYETYCNICNQKFYHGHSHVTCTTCNGKGYW